MRVCICATYHAQYNGYAKVAYELSKRLALKEGLELTYFGFQNFHPASAKHRRELPECVTVYDAAANEEPKKKGFGIENIKAYFTENKFDVVVIYNDMIIINAVLEELKKVEDRKFKVVAYVDQVYLYQKKHFINALNSGCDAAIAFTPAWKESLVEQGVTIPITDLRHGIDTSTYFRIPKHLARRYFGLSREDFIVMNLNRNQPRKRWDICIKAFAEAVSRVRDKPGPRPLKLLIATSLNGSWNLLEIYERELKKRGISMEEGQKHLIVIDAPQRLPDGDINILMNCADVGINTCDGEGFGLCQFEQASIGVPQVVPKLGGFMDFFDDESAYMCSPILNYYVDAGRDGVGGEAQICDYTDFTSGILAFYTSPQTVADFGERARKRITGSGDYCWDGLATKLHEFLAEVTGVSIERPPPKGVTPEPEKATPDHDKATPEPEKATPDHEKATPEPEKAVTDANKEPLDVNLVQLPEKKVDLSEIKTQLAALQKMVATLAEG